MNIAINIDIAIDIAINISNDGLIDVSSVLSLPTFLGAETKGERHTCH